MILIFWGGVILVCSANPEINLAILKQIKKMGLLGISIDKYILSKNRDKVLKVYDMLDDVKSKEIYAQVILSRIKNLDIEEELVVTDTYFCLKQFCKMKSNEVFVDIGAFVGDSLEKYIQVKFGVFEKIYAIEPDRNNCNALLNRIQRLRNEWGIEEARIEAIHAGIGKNTDKQMHIKTEKGKSNLGSSLINDSGVGAEQVKMYSLDEYFDDKKISFVKADIESYEFDMLTGAKEVIKKNKPLMAISIYHNASDLFDIPLLINNICQDYKFKVRHHTYEYYDTVLYAYI